MRAFLIKEGILIKESESKGFGDVVAHEVSKTFQFCNGSGKWKKKLLQKFK
jgi:hypothetical protein